MKQLSHLEGCTGFWLWALVGAVGVAGLDAFPLLFLAIALGYFVHRRKEWRDGPVLLGMIAGAGVPLLLVAAINWDKWHHRTPDNGYPNPYGWGGVGIALMLAGIAAYALNRRSV
jgi:hypothetical protein